MAVEHVLLQDGCETGDGRERRIAFLRSNRESQSLRSAHSVAETAIWHAVCVSGEYDYEEFDAESGEVYLRIFAVDHAIDCWRDRTMGLDECC